MKEKCLLIMFYIAMIALPLFIFLWIIDWSWVNPWLILSLLFVYATIWITITSYSNIFSKKDDIWYINIIWSFCMLLVFTCWSFFMIKTNDCPNVIDWTKTMDEFWSFLSWTTLFMISIIWFYSFIITRNHKLKVYTLNKELLFIKSKEKKFKKDSNKDYYTDLIQKIYEIWKFEWSHFLDIFYSEKNIDTFFYKVSKEIPNNILKKIDLDKIKSIPEIYISELRDYIKKLK